MLPNALVDALEKYLHATRVSETRLKFSNASAIKVYVTSNGFVFESTWAGNNDLVPAKVAYKKDEGVIIVKLKKEASGDIRTVARVDASDFVPEIDIEDARSIYMTFAVARPRGALTPRDDVIPLFINGLETGKAEIYLTDLEIIIDFKIEEEIRILKPDYGIDITIVSYYGTPVSVRIGDKEYEMGKDYRYYPVIEVIGNVAKISFREWKVSQIEEHLIVEPDTAERIFSQAKQYYAGRELTPDALGFLIIKLTGVKYNDSLIRLPCEYEVGIDVNKGGWSAVVEPEDEPRRRVAKLVNRYNEHVLMVDDARLKYSRYIPVFHFNINRNMMLFGVMDNPDVIPVPTPNPVQKLVDGMKTGSGMVILSGNISLSATCTSLVASAPGFSLKVTPYMVEVNGKKFVVVPSKDISRSDVVHYFPVVYVMGDYVVFKFEQIF